MHGYMDGQRIDEIDMSNPKQSRIESKRVGKKDLSHGIKFEAAI